MQISDFITPTTIFFSVMLLWLVADGVAKKFLSKDELGKIEDIAQIAVMAAEQMANIQSISPNERKGYALNFIRNELKKHNIDVSETLINAIIEAKVLWVNEISKSKN